MANKLLSDILKLSSAERLLLVEDIWDSIATFPEAVQLTEKQIRNWTDGLKAITRIRKRVRHGEKSRQDFHCVLDISFDDLLLHSASTVPMVSAD